MNPIRKAGVVAFLDWIKRSHPGVRSLRALSKDEFLKLAVLFEQSKGMIIDESHDVYRKWESTQWTFANSQSDEQALGKLR